jgi:hypothetical protein
MGLWRDYSEAKSMQCIHSRMALGGREWHATAVPAVITYVCC